MREFIAFSLATGFAIAITIACLAWVTILPAIGVLHIAGMLK